MNIKKFRDKTVISKTLILSGTKLKIFTKDQGRNYDFNNIRGQTVNIKKSRVQTIIFKRSRDQNINFKNIRGKTLMRA